MIIGVMSDTHGNRALMHQVANAMEEGWGVELIFHLGDDYADAQELKLFGHAVYMVPGLQCPEYHGSKVNKRLVKTFHGVSIACTHAEKDLRHTERAASIILTGHTHVAAIEHIGFSLYMNPGHLKSSWDRGEYPSFGTITLEDSQVTARIHELDGVIRFEHTLEREALA